MKVLGLFSGIGGFELGFQRAGFEIGAMCECDPYCRAVLAKHWPGVPCFEDVRSLGTDSLDFRPDVVTGGFPCQDISLAGKGAGLGGERSGLWREFHRIIAETRPAWAVIENVSALRSRGLDVVLGQLAEIGYDAEWHCIPAAAVGAPHRRDRVWIVAYSDHVRCNQSQHTGAMGGSSEAEPERQRSKAADGPFGASSDVAYPNGHAREPRGSGDSEQGPRRRDADRSSLGAQPVADANGPGLEGGVLGASLQAEIASAQRSGGPDGWWRIEPDVGRVADGVPRRVDRLRALGNAVVPQIPQIIAEAILRAEGVDNSDRR